MLSSSVKRTGFGSLPEDILMIVFLHLHQSDIYSLSYTCKFLRDISRPTRFRDVELLTRTSYWKLCDIARKEEFVSCAKLVHKITLRRGQILSSPLPHQFSSLESLAISRFEEVDQTFLASLGGITSLRSLDLRVDSIGMTSSSDFTSSKLTSLSIAVRETPESSAASFVRNILLGGTQKSIVALTAHITRPFDQTTIDPFPSSIENFPALQYLDLSGDTLKPTFSKFPELFPALTTFQCSSRPLVDTPLHDGSAGHWGELKDLSVVYNPMRDIGERIFGHTTKLKSAVLRGLSTDSALQVFRSIAFAKANVLRLTSLEIEMESINEIENVVEEVLECAFKTMLNLEHFALVCHSRAPEFLLGPWLCSRDRFASTLTSE